MSALKVRQTEAKLLEMFEAHLDLADIGSQDPERRTKVLSRCLAAFAIFIEAGCSEQEAASSVWDGSDDNGVDAAFNNATDQRVIIVQAKWIKKGAGEPDANEIASFSNGVKDLVEDQISNFGTRLHIKISDISRALDTPGVTIKIVLISTGSSIIAKHGTQNLDRVLEELNGNDTDQIMAAKSVFGLSEVYANLAANQSNEEITLEANLSDWSHISSPYSAYFGTIDGLQLKDWWASFGKRLVTKNIRNSLGSTEVNEQIRQTALEAPENFWYYNNGITLIADDLIKAPKSAASRSAANFLFRAASIVNGAQTVSTLGRIEKDENLGRIRVPIRVILLKNAPAAFGTEVTRTNNLQNRVEGRDFASQDPQQLRLQQEMGIENVEYQFLRSENFVASESSCELVELTTALACASGDPTHAVQLKTGIGRFFADIRRAPYKSLYNPSISGARAFNAVLVQRAIDRWIETKKTTINKKSGFTWTVLIHGNRVLAAAVFRKIPGTALVAPIADFRSALGGLGIEDKCELVYNSMCDILGQKHANKFLAVLFKNPTLSKQVFEHAVTT